MSIALPAWRGRDLPAIDEPGLDVDWGVLGRFLRRVLTAVVIIVATSLATGAVVADPAAAASVVATTTVNVRSGPGTQYKIIGTLTRGQSVDKLGAEGAWTRIRYGRVTAYAASQFLTTRNNFAAPPITIVGTKITTTAVNLRVGPGLSSRIDRVLPKGTRVSVTGRTAKGYTEVVFGGARRWVTSQYLTTALPRVIGYRTATTDLIVRSTSGADYRDLGEIAKGSRVAITGTMQNGRAQIVYRTAIRWVTARYLANGSVDQPPAPRLPRVIGYRYATTELNLRSSPADDYRLLGTVPLGTRLGITGVVQRGRAKIVYRSTVRWVTAAYLSRSRPTAGGGSGGGSGVEKGLKPNAIKVHRAAMRAFPQVTTYYGVRPDSIPDHPNGLALDIMIPGNYRSASGRALGQRIAAWAKANHSSLGIEYIIWDQHIWNVRRSGEGWRYMADRGSDSANHKNHVHVTVFG
jgi:uncharacterized protein YgiM (DUF1202 family)